MILGALVVAAIPVAAEPVWTALPGPTARWHSQEAGGLLVVGDVGPARLEEITRQLLVMHGALSRIAGLPETTPPPVTVFALGRGSTFTSLRDSMLVRPGPSAVGVFLGTGERHFLVVDMASPAESERVLAHEFTHAVLHAAAPGLPLWLEEGLAEFFSTFRVRGSRVDLGRPISTHTRHLHTRPPLNLEETLADSGAGASGGDAPWPESRYAEAWALVHYLLAGRPEGWATLGPLLEHLDTGESFREALAAATGQSFDTLQRAVRFSVLNRSFPTRTLTIGALHVPPLPPPTRLPYPLLVTHVAELLVAAGGHNLEQAARILDHAVELAPDQPFPRLVRATAHLARGDRIRARTDLERALILRPGDPRACVLLGELLLAELPIVHAPGARAPALDAQRALELFTTALGHIPLDPRALEGFGRCFLHLDRDPAPGIAALRQSLQVSPRRTKALLALILLLAGTSQHPEAQELAAGPLQRLGSPEARRHAADALALADLARVNPLLAERRVDEAIAILESANERAGSQHLRDQVAKELEAVRHHRAVVRDERIFCGIAAMANDGAFIDALVRLEAALPEFTTETIRRQALLLRDRLRSLTQEHPGRNGRREP